jgi:hypothetical protein
VMVCYLSSVHSVSHAMKCEQNAVQTCVHAANSGQYFKISAPSWQLVVVRKGYANLTKSSNSSAQIIMMRMLKYSLLPSFLQRNCLEEVLQHLHYYVNLCAMLYYK